MRLSRPPFRWLAAIAALALAPKCVLCVLAYVGIGAATLGRVEICGAAKSRLHAAAPWLLAAGTLAGAGALLLFHHRLRRRPRRCLQNKPVFRETETTLGQGGRGGGGPEVRAAEVNAGSAWFPSHP